MSNLFVKIKEDHLQFRKTKDAIRASLLTTLIGEIQTKSFQPNVHLTDDLVLSVIKYFLKNIEETLKHSDNEQLRIEKEILSTYVPAEVDEATLKGAIVNFVNSGKGVVDITIKSVMDHLKSLEINFSKQLAAKLIKEYL